MVHLITPDEIAFTARVTETEIRQRLVEEVLGQIGGLDELGKPRRELVTSVKRGDGRSGGYTITVKGPAPARVLLPGPKPEPRS